jgi:fucose permease
MGILFALSTLGGATIPWLVGYVSTSFGGLRTALIVPLAGCVIITALYWNPALGKYQSMRTTEKSRV